MSQEAFPGAPKGALCPCGSGKTYRDCHYANPNAPIGIENADIAPVAIIDEIAASQLQSSLPIAANKITTIEPVVDNRVNQERPNWYSANVAQGETEQFVAPRSETVGQNPTPKTHKGVTWGKFLGIAALLFAGFLVHIGLVANGLNEEIFAITVWSIAGAAILALMGLIELFRRKGKSAYPRRGVLVTSALMLAAFLGYMGHSGLAELADRGLTYPAAPAAPVVPDEGPEEQPLDIYYTTGNLNLRTEPTTASDVITVIPANSPVEILDYDAYEDWVEVVFDGNTGWVSRNWIAPEQQ